mmetsp:Transcript_7874/g.29455  ORF Transcript_7874/g.29455 Transcript_7874/m.29455 type:complete len:91 (+) Transcript_7874:155-427(+)
MRNSEQVSCMKLHVGRLATIRRQNSTLHPQTTTLSPMMIRTTTLTLILFVAFFVSSSYAGEGDWVGSFSLEQHHSSALAVHKPITLDRQC